MRLEPNLALTVRRLNTEEPSCPHSLTAERGQFLKGSLGEISRMGLVLLHRDFLEVVMGGCSGT